VATLRLKLSPLVTQEEKLAVHLSGGVTIPSTSKGDLFVRSGWQSRAIERHIEDDQSAKMSMDTTRSSFDGFDCLVGNTGQILQNLQQDIVELWNLPLTKVLISQRKLRLDEWSEL
jgi:guanine nucleotide-binding protein alpha-1 subunit